VFALIVGGAVAGAFGSAILSDITSMRHHGLVTVEPAVLIVTLTHWFLGLFACVREDNVSTETTLSGH